MIPELRFAIRALARSRGFAMAAIGVLALGIGAAATVFSVVDAIQIRPLPFPEANRLAVIYATQPSRGVRRGGASFPDLNDWRAQLPGFDGIFAFLGANVSLTGSGEAERVGAALVSEDFFRVTQVPPALGHTFRGDEWKPGGPKVAMPPGFDFPDVALWAPFTFPPEVATREERALGAVAQLRDGVSLDAVQAQVDAFNARLERAYPATNAGWRAADARDRRAYGARRPTVLGVAAGPRAGAAPNACRPRTGAHRVARRCKAAPGSPVRHRRARPDDVRRRSGPPRARCGDRVLAARPARGERRPSNRAPRGPVTHRIPFRP